MPGNAIFNRKTFSAPPGRLLPELIRSHAMHFHAALGPVLSLIAGVLVLLIPRLLNYIVAIYLILVGLFGILALSPFPMR